MVCLPKQKLFCPVRTGAKDTKTNLKGKTGPVRVALVQIDFVERVAGRACHMISGVAHMLNHSEVLKTASSLFESDNVTLFKLVVAVGNGVVAGVQRQSVASSGSGIVVLRRSGSHTT